MTKIAHNALAMSVDLLVTDRHGVPTQLIDMCERELSEALGRGWGERDRTIASTLQEERAGVKLRLDRP